VIEARCAYYGCRRVFDATPGKQGPPKKYCCGKCRNAAYEERRTEGLVTPLALAAEAIAKFYYRANKIPPSLEEETKWRNLIADAITFYHEEKTRQTSPRGGVEA